MLHEVSHARAGEARSVALKSHLNCHLGNAKLGPLPPSPYHPVTIAQTKLMPVDVMLPRSRAPSLAEICERTPSGPSTEPLSWAPTSSSLMCRQECVCAGEAMEDRPASRSIIPAGKVMRSHSPRSRDAPEVAVRCPLRYFIVCVYTSTACI